MKLHDIACVTLYEIKEQSRRWEFRLFVFVALIGITLCHVYWQNYNESWNVSALPCSIPLANAYLFSVLQSLFLILIVTDFPRRECIRGEMECIFSRPVDNTAYTWGKILGNLILFMFVNIAVSLSCLFFVHVSGIAPYKFGLYLFYGITLCLPSFMFVTGLSLFLARILHLRFLVITILVMLWGLSVVWLPYHWHGTFDFLGGGVPNLFSDVTGHVGLGNYLLHRGSYFLLGWGCMLFSVGGMRRLPNFFSRVRVCSLTGLLLCFIAFVGMFTIENGYRATREIRAGYRDHFRHYWNEKCPRVCNHDIVLEQREDSLSMSSDMELYNPYEESLNQLILFLNPGLQVKTLMVENKEIPFQREGQVIVIPHTLLGKDTVSLHVQYEGQIDERFTNLQLRDSAYEDSFRGDFFFPTGRRGAFVSDDFLLLTPACAWYPVSVPPVNPDIPAYTGRDFTRFRLTVIHPSQRVLCAQGEALRRGDTCFFQPTNPLSGMSLCGGDYELHERRIPDLNMRFYTFKTRGNPLREVGNVRRKHIYTYLTKWVYPKRPYGWKDRDWYEKNSQALFLMEVPFPFYIEPWFGKLVTGMVEPGMVFFPERGYDGLVKGFKDETGKTARAEYIFEVLMESDSPYKTSHNLHPLLGLGRSSRSFYDHRELNPYRCWELLEESGLWIQSEDFPFVGYLFDRMALNRGEYVGSFLYVSSTRQHRRDRRLTDESLAGHNLYTIFQDRTMRQDILYDSYILKEQELVDRIAENVPIDTFLTTFGELARSLRGRVDIDVFEQEMNARLGKELHLKELLKDWLYTEHRQFFKVKDLYENHYPAGREERHEGRESYYSDTEWIELKGKVMNCGKTGGVVTVNFMGLLGKQPIREHYTCYLNPGEAKSFYLVLEVVKNIASSSFYTGLSANEPRLFDFDVIRHEEGVDGMGPVPITWKSIDPSEFCQVENEIIVDNDDDGFSIKDANRTWLQKWFEKPLEPRTIGGTIPSRWTPSVDMYYYGDSVRSCYFKGFGKGDYTATWRTNLEAGGKYRISARVSRRNIDGFASFGAQKGVIYHYTVNSTNGEEQVGVELDHFFQPRQWEGWVSLGEFDLPAGEVSVTLSDYDELGRDYVAVVADVVKWEKLED